MELQETPVDLAMPAYGMKQLTKHIHIAPLKPQHSWYVLNPIKYGKDNQSPSPLDKSPCLNEAQKKRTQQIVGSFLYYAQAVDPTILMALSEIASQQAVPTENTMECVNQFLDYMWTHPGAIILYRASDMISMFILTCRTSLHQKLAAVLVGTSSLAVSHKIETQFI